MADSTLVTLMKSKTQPFKAELQELGIRLGKLYTDHGLPIDMSLDKLPHSKEQKISIDRQRKANVKMVESFIATGETGVY